MSHVIAQDAGLSSSIGALTVEDWIRAVAVLVLALLVSRLVRSAVNRAGRSRRTEPQATRVMSRFAAYVVFIVGAIYSLEAVGVDLAPLLGLIGIFGLAIALALQDIFANFVAGLILLLRRPFKPGDEIETGDHRGKIEDVNLRSVKMQQPDGVVVFVPNSDVLSNAIVNYTERGVRRTTVEVGVAYGADLERAKSVIVEAIANLEGVVDELPPSAFLHRFGDSSMNIAVNFWHAPAIGDEWAVRDRVVVAVKAALDSGGIEIPFPQRVITNIG